MSKIFQKNSKNFAQGFHWHQAPGYAEGKVAFTVPPEHFDTMIKVVPVQPQRAPVLLIGFPKRQLRSHFEFFQYAAGIFTARLRYDVGPDQMWERVEENIPQKNKIGYEIIKFHQIRINCFLESVPQITISF